MDFSIHQPLLKKISASRGFFYLPLFGLMAVTFSGESEHHVELSGGLQPAGLTILFF